MLGVVARIGFVGHQRQCRIYLDRQIGVDVDARLVASQVPVIGRPGFIFYQVKGELFAGRQLEKGQGTAPGLFAGQVEDGQDAVWGQLQPLFSVGQSVGQRAAAGKKVLQLGVGCLKDRLVDRLGGDVKVALDLAHKVEPVSRQVADHGRHGARLPGQKILALGVAVAGLDGLLQLLGIVGQGIQGAGVAGLDPILQFRRANVGVDEAGEVAIQTQGQGHIASADGVHCSSRENRWFAHGVGVGTPLLSIMASLCALCKPASQPTVCSRVSGG